MLYSKQDLLQIGTSNDLQQRRILFPKRMRKWPFIVLQSILCLAPNAANFGVRKFPTYTIERQLRLERSGGAFVAGYNSKVEWKSQIAPNDVAHDFPQNLIGFFLEGAGMSVAITDAFPFRLVTGQRLAAFLKDTEEAHPYLTTVGAGWALAKTPWRRNAILDALDPALSLLAFDGWGFCNGFFRPAVAVKGAPKSLRRRFGPLAVQSWDRGLGRSLWFSTGGNPQAAWAILKEIAPERQSDIAAGIGLAVTYAGGLSNNDACALRQMSGDLAQWVAQGSAFALEAHVRAGTDTTETLETFRAISGVEPDRGIELVRQHRPVLAPDTPRQLAFAAHQAWRVALSADLKSIGEI